MTRTDHTARIRVTLREASQLVTLIEDELDRSPTSEYGHDLVTLRTKVIAAGDRVLEGVAS